MIEDIKKYEDRIKKILKSDSSKTNWNELREYHYRQIHFLQNERLIHLLVTLGVALFALITFTTAIISQIWGMYIVAVLLLGLLVPYLFHYRKLENGVQSFYKVYDDLNDKVNGLVNGFKKI